MSLRPPDQVGRLAVLLDGTWVVAAGEEGMSGGVAVINAATRYHAGRWTCRGRVRAPWSSPQRGST
jgi:hypothetical protein